MWIPLRHPWLILWGVCLVLAVPLGCKQVHVGFLRFQLINHTPHMITYYGIARTEQGLDTARNLLGSPLGPGEVFDAELRLPGRYWLRAVADVEGVAVERRIGPEVVREGNYAWAWYVRDGEIHAGSSARDLYAVTDLPAVVITTGGARIPDDPKVGATLDIAYDPAGGLSRPLGLPVDFEGYAGIEIRGNTSQTFPKQSFGLETWDAAGEDLEVSLLGLPREEDWVLYGPWMDRSLMRNVVGYAMWGSLGYYAPRTRFVELYLNTTNHPVVEETYHGVYVLTEKVKRDRNRVNITRLLPEHLEEPAITGGYLLELQGPDEMDPGSVFIDVAGEFILAIQDPAPATLPEAQRAWITQYIEDFEAALFGPEFADPERGYAAYIDVDSFVDYILIQELYKNRDGFRSSTWMSKGRGAKLRMGPVWDLNICFGYFSFNGFQKPEGWYLNKPKRDLSHSPWTDRLFEDPAFVARCIARWRALREDALSLEQIHRLIDTASQELHTAQVRNFVRWESLGKTLLPDIRFLMFLGPHPDSWEGEVAYLKAWIGERVRWMDANIERL